MSDHASSSAQPKPTGHGRPVVVEVLHDMLKRREHGILKYGTELRADNGRQALADAYQESLDLSLYLKQRLLEDDGAIAAEPVFTLREMDLIRAGINNFHALIGGRGIELRALDKGAADTAELRALYAKIVNLQTSQIG